VVVRLRAIVESPKRTVCKLRLSQIKQCTERGRFGITKIDWPELLEQNCELLLSDGAQLPPAE
jgi:hypothetical protein